MNTPEPPDRRPADQPSEPGAEQPTEAVSPEYHSGDTRQLPADDRAGPAAHAAPAPGPETAAGTPVGAAAARPAGSGRFRLQRPGRTWLIAGAAVLALLLVGGIGFAVGRHSGHHRGFGHHGFGPAAMERGMGGHGGFGHRGGMGMGPGGPEGGLGPGMGPGMGPGGMGPGGPRGMAHGAPLAGTVASVDGANLVVTPDGGAPAVTVPTTDRTRVRGAGNGLAGLQPGQRVLVRLAADKTAAAVMVPQARAMGTVTGLNGDRATLVRPDGLADAVDLAAVNPKPANGDVVFVTGTATDNGATIKVVNLRVLPKAS
jgi:hypothetical protein